MDRAAMRSKLRSVSVTRCAHDERRLDHDVDHPWWACRGSTESVIVVVRTRAPGPEPSPEFTPELV